jgi:hypothetical protein
VGERRPEGNAEQSERHVLDLWELCGARG